MRKPYDDGWQERLRVDFSTDSDRKEAILQNLLTSIGESELKQPSRKENIKMKHSMKRTTRIAIAACLAAVMLSATAYAIVKTFHLGPYAQYTQYTKDQLEPTKKSIASMKKIYEENRDQWEGKVFDANGRPINDLASHVMSSKEFFDKDGQQLKVGSISMESNDNGESKASSLYICPIDERPQLNVATFEHFDDAKAYLCFKPTIPTYIPEGYAIDRFELYKEGEQIPKDSKYLSVYLRKDGAKDDKEVYIQIRFMDKDTAFEAGSDESMRRITINGHDAVTDGKSIDLLVGDIIYMIMPGESGLTFEEVQKIAESIQG